jgi:multidrug efflux system membrane fusion protein
MRGAAGEGGGVRKRLVAFAAVAVLVAAGIGVRFGLERTEQAAAALSPDAPAVPVTVGVVTARDMPVFLQGVGTVQAYNAVTVKSRVDGQIVGVDFTEGQEVKQGTVLLQIDPRAFQAQLDQAQAARAKDAAQLQQAEADLERNSKLLANGYQSRQSYDQQKALVAQLRASIDGDQAQIATAQLNLGYAIVTAPISGRLSARLVDVGNLVHASDNTPLVTIAQVQPIFVSFTLPQQEIDAIRAAQTRAPLVVQAYSGDDKEKLAEGKLTLIDNAVDIATGTIHLKAEYANRDERLWPGEFVNLRVVLTVRQSVPTVPAQTVQEGPDGYFAYVVKPGDTVERRPVEVAAIQDGVAAVSAGLEPGERVVVDGQYRLTNGARISTTPEAATAATH